MPTHARRAWLYWEKPRQSAGEAPFSAPQLTGCWVGRARAASGRSGVTLLFGRDETGTGTGECTENRVSLSPQWRPRAAPAMLTENTASLKVARRSVQDPAACQAVASAIRAGTLVLHNIPNHATCQVRT